MATLLFSLGNEPQHRYKKTVPDGTEYDNLLNFLLARPPYTTRWLLVDDSVWLRTDAIVAVEIDAKAAERAIAA